MGKASKSVALFFALLAWAATTSAILAVKGASDVSGQEVVRRGPVSLQYSDPWHQAPVVNSFPYGLELATPVQLRKAYANLWTGRIVGEAPTPGGLPPGFASNVHGVPSRQQVALHGVPAMRYSGVVDPGASRFTLYVLATEESDFAILCAGATWNDANQCEGMMKAATLDSVGAVPPGADASLSVKLERVVGTLQEQSDLVSGLAAARSIEVVARSARRLHSLYRRAGQSLAALETPPRDEHAVSALANILVAEASSLKELAASAAASRESEYEAAAVSVEASSRQARSGLLALHRIGFATVPLLRLLSIPPMPTVEEGQAALGQLATKPEAESDASTVFEERERAQHQSQAATAEPRREEREWEEAEPVGGSTPESTERGSEPKPEKAEQVGVDGAR
jgi:hypothetical protein